MNKNQRGFSAVEILLVLVVVGLIAAAAYMVGSRQQKTTPPNQSATQSKSSAPVKTTTFNDQNSLYSFQLPDKWIAQYLSGSEQFLTLKPAAFNASGDENNWVIQVTIIPVPGEYPGGPQFANYEEFKNTALQQTVDKHPTSKETHINGAPVWEFAETAPDISATGPPEITGGEHDIHYYFHKDSDKIIEVFMRTYQHASTNYLGKQVTSAYDYRQYTPQLETIVKSFKQN